MQIIKSSKRIEVTDHQLIFRYVADPSAGFSFTCDADGKVQVTEANGENYAGCLAGSVRGQAVVCEGVKEFTHRYTEPAEGRCVCRAVVYLDGFTNTCERCGRDYNMSGQLLAPRSQWGEETGETF